MKVHTSISFGKQGQPDVTLHPDDLDYPSGRLQIYPAGVGGLCLFLSVDDWHNLATAVETTLSEKR